VVWRNADADGRHRPGAPQSGSLRRHRRLGRGLSAAGFVAEAPAYGLRTCELNLEAADNADLFDERRYGPASQTVPARVDELLST
jgi:hypothetical protein